MSKRTRYSPELRDRAARMVFEHAHEPASQWADVLRHAAVGTGLA